MSWPAAAGHSKLVDFVVKLDRSRRVCVAASCVVMWCLLAPWWILWTSRLAVAGFVILSVLAFELGTKEQAVEQHEDDLYNENFEEVFPDLVMADAVMLTPSDISTDALRITASFASPPPART